MAIVLIGVVIGLHLLLALGFMLYFFHVPNTVVVADANTTITTANNKDKSRLFSL